MCQEATLQDGGLGLCYLGDISGAVASVQKDAYFHVPMFEGYRRYLRFLWKGTLYHFRALPFGLTLALWVFTKMLQLWVAVLRSQGLTLCAYLTSGSACDPYSGS